MLPLILTNLSILLVYEDQYKPSQYSLYIQGAYITKIHTQTALICRCGQVVKTLLFHGRIAGPTPASVTKNTVLQFNRLERRPVTPMVGVRFPLESPYGAIAQLEKRPPCKRKTVGSNLTSSTIYCGLEKRYLASPISQRWVVRLYHHATNLRLLQQKEKQIIYNLYYFNAPKMHCYFTIWSLVSGMQPNRHRRLSQKQ